MWALRILIILLLPVFFQTQPSQARELNSVCSYTSPSEEQDIPRTLADDTMEDDSSDEESLGTDFHESNVSTLKHSLNPSEKLKHTSCIFSAQDFQSVI